ncbi:HORMA domain-containing protein 1 [Amphibalanus amphitrite]|uniref:HORMA domain-containing protein 1 n=1 Tax=Amphibalanus amphitrite TaxID=1232801 RepID=A0A6A4W6U2_AMPAM|nr:HORMA domain-containing protein 1 [Amphibalanus amphitrite]KAF0303076.1 HORMA domain-containing protein 1 [Amphibalanus amphitrite]
MSTLQMMRPKQSQMTGTWSSVFPVEQATAQQSAQFVKKLLAVAVSNLTYLRAIFPEQAFGERTLDGLQLKVLRDDAGCPGAWQITQWIKACFDALDKKYLRQLTVVLYLDPSDPDTVIESYTFRFTYSSSGGVSMQHGSDGDGQPASIPATVTSEETYKATVRMLRTIVVLTQTLRPLPDDVMMSMKLLYFDDVTPPDYEPPGFRPAETHQIFFSSEPINVRVGDVCTPHHTVKLRLKTDSSQFVPQEGDDETIEHATVKTAPSVEDAVPRERDQERPSTSSQQRQPRPREPAAAAEPEPSLAESVSGRSPGLPASAVDTSGTPAAGAVPEAEDEPRVLCVCGVHEDDGLMVLCELCHNWQHGICFLVLSEDEAPASHICDTCALASGRPCTDARLPALARSTRMATCLYRRGLCACEEMSRVQPARLAQRLGVDVAVASGLMSRLDKDGLLKPLSNRSKGTVRVVDKERLLNEAFPRYLNRPAPAAAHRPAGGHQAVDEVAERAGRMELDGPEDGDHSPPATPRTGPAGDGPEPRSAGRKRRATPRSQPDKEFEVADSQEFRPETVGGRAKKFKASRTDGIAA